MRRREFMSALLLASATSVRAQERAEQHRIAIIRPAGPTALISDTGIRFYRAFFEELRRLGDSEGRNLTVERYSGEGRPEGFLGLAREVVNRNPEVIVVANDAIAQAAHAADDAIPIVLITGGDPIRTGLATSLARPGGSITGVSVEEGNEIGGKRLQILKEAVPSASRVAYLDVRQYWVGDARSLREPNRRLQISLVGMLLGALLILNVAQAWLNQATKVKLREGLVKDLFDQWLTPRRAFRLADAGKIGANPDQRIHEDARHLTELLDRSRHRPPAVFAPPRQLHRGSVDAVGKRCVSRERAQFCDSRLHGLVRPCVRRHRLLD